LEKKYRAFENHSDIYYAAVGAMAEFARAFTSEELGIPYASANPNLTGSAVAILPQLVGNTEYKNYMDLQKYSVETRIKGPRFSFSLNYGNPEKLAAAQKIIRAYLPDFKLPKQFNQKEKSSEVGTTGAPLFPLSGGKSGYSTFSVGESVTTLMKVKDIADKEIEFTIKGQSREDKFIGKKTKIDKFALPQNYVKNGSLRLY
jgi:hypothetical protein